MPLLYTVRPDYSFQTPHTCVENAHKTNDRCNPMDIDTGYEIEPKINKSITLRMASTWRTLNLR